MGTISSASSKLSLLAIGTATSTNVDSTANIGVTNDKQSYTGADIAYSYTVLSTGATDVATLTLSSGAVAQTTGTPTITDAGTDFEGVTLATMVTLNAVLVKFDEVGTGNIDVSGKVTVVGEEDSQTFLLNLPTGSTTLTDIVLTFDEIGQQATVTIVGATS